MVRTDPRNLLKQTNVWTLNISVPSLQIDSLKWQTNGSFWFRVTGSAPAGVVVQMSTNLVQWNPAYTGSLTSGKLLYTNWGTATNARRFYRAKTPP